ncbi:PREDICTED: uncharacterized protein LOC104759829 [Camelina sativa]|uniref:Uncharacterized protein LOC104759829 n=1 Tax=Camelina sativa TaxID=90675 RepID=A0ABM0X5G3_CAMSA|nr:PREDICTED: uncharacterized protein LOC104759829 [Camelina sativa]
MELQKTLSVHAWRRLFTFKIWKSDKERVIATCVDKKSRYGEKASAQILAELLQSKFANGKKGPRACELPSMVLEELNVTITYMKAWNAKELAIEAARGNEEDNYRFLATYFQLVKKTNPGTISDMHTTVKKETGKTLFKYLFFAFGASIAGYKYLRKVIVIDGTTMKGKYKGCLVAASVQDGNMQIYPLGFGVVEKENDAGWAWFFRNLQKFVPDEEDLVFVSDRHLAIYSALAKVYPLAHHATCTVHLFRNVKHNFGCEGLVGRVSKAALAYTVGDFRYWWREIKHRDQRCADYQTEIGFPHWTLSHFPENRYNIMSSNISESLNAAMKKAVEYPIVSMVEFIRAMLMRWFWCRRKLAGKTNSKCTPEIEDLLIDHLKESKDCGVLSVSNWIYQINDGNSCVFTVDLERKTCTCRVFDVLKIPCCHALSTCRYEGLIMPVPNEKDEDLPAEVADGDVNPPRTARGGDRPKKKRIPSKGEVHHNIRPPPEARSGSRYIAPPQWHFFGMPNLPFLRSRELMDEAAEGDDEDC